MIYRTGLILFMLTGGILFSEITFAQLPEDTIVSFEKNQLRWRDNFWYMTDKKGQVISTNKYEQVKVFKPNPKSKPFFLIQENGLWAYADPKGQLMANHLFTFLTPFNQTLLIYRTVDSGPFLGLIDLKGQIMQSPRFSYFVYDSSINAIRTYLPFEAGTLLQGLLSEQGATLLEPIYRQFIKRGDYLIPETLDGKKGWFDKRTHRLLMPAYVDSIGPLIDGYARIKLEDNWGLMDKNGKNVLPLHFQSLFLAGEGRVLATKHPGWITRSFDTLYHKELYPLGNSFYRIQTSKGSWLLNTHGDTLSGPWDSIGEFDENGFWIQDQNLFFRIDTSGKKIGELGYMSLIKVENNLMLASLPGGGYHLIASGGKKLLNQTINQWKKTEDGSLWLKFGLKWQLFNYKKQELIGPLIDSPGRVGNHCFKVALGDGIGIIDQSGNWISGPIWDREQAIDWLGGTMIFKEWGNTYSTIDGDGCEHALQYADSAYVSGGLIAFRLRGFWGLSNVDGQVVFPAQAKKIRYLDSLFVWQVENDTAFGVMDRDGCFVTSFANWFDSILVESAPYSVVKKNGKYGMIDPEGRLRISNRYDELRPFHYGRAAFKINNKWGFIDLSEGIVVQPSFDSVDNFIEQVAKVWLNGSSFLIQQTGRILLDSVVTPKKLEFDFWLVEKNGKKGIVNGSGKKVLPMIYDQISALANDRLLIRSGIQFGLSDGSGQLLLPLNQYSIIVSANGVDFIGSIPPTDYSFTFFPK